MKRTDADSWHESPDDLLELMRRADAGHGSPPVVSGFEDLREIARGGSSVVYRARELATGSDVAVKVLSDGLFSGDTAALRFDREFHAVTTLRHPNLVGGRDRGQTDDGRRWISMEYVDGPRLDEWIADRRDAPDLDETLALFVSIGRAVQHAHQRGVLHRDLKPANVRIDGSGHPRVLDFGIAKIDGPVGDMTTLATVSRQFLGTPAYAAPEQVAGRINEIDVRTDVHALGALLFELVTGRCPFPIDKGIGATLHAIEHDEPTRPSRLDARADVELDAIVLCALAKRPEDRYQSVDAFLADLDRRSRGLPVTAHPPGALYELRKWIGRNRLLFGVAAGTFLLLLAFGLTTSVLLENERSTRASKERLSDFLLGLLLSTDPYRTTDPARSVDALLAGAVDRLKEELADDPAEQANLLNVLGIHYRTSARYDRAEAALGEALRIRRALHDGDHEEIAESMTELSNLHLFTGRDADSEAGQRAALAMNRRLFGERHEAVASNLGRLGQILAQQARLDEAGPLLEQALALRLELHGEANPATVASMHQMSHHALRTGDIPEARRLQERALELRLEHDRPAPVIAASRGALGDISMNEGDAPGAIDQYRQAIGIAAGALGVDHEDVALLNQKLAFALHKEGETDEALSVAQEAHAVLRRTLPEHHPALVMILADVGAYRTSTGRLEEAESALRDAIASAAAVGHPPTRLAGALNTLGRAHLAAGDPAAAEEMLSLALESARAAGSPPSAYNKTLSTLASIRLARGAYEAAIHDLSAAIDGVDEENARAGVRALLLARRARAEKLAGRGAAAEETLRMAREELRSVAKSGDPLITGNARDVISEVESAPRQD